ncbi:hypothetical protein BN133_3106 [Cronobacter dublinensis 582]|nr:hypothetical protein BN133_3106 [Cronobacter dublinensis 582]
MRTEGQCQKNKKVTWQEYTFDGETAAILSPARYQSEGIIVIR